MKKNRALLLFFLSISIFKLSAHGKLDYPQGGESFTYGQTVTIQWQTLIYHADIENWDAYYSLDGGANWLPIAIDISPTTFSYDWTIPSTTTTNARIKVTMDNSNYDYESESSNFSIDVAASTLIEKSISKISIAPNPFQENATFSIESNSTATELIILNSMNQAIEIIPYDGNEKIPFNRGTLLNGIYFYRLFSNDKEIANGKFIVF